MAAVTLEYARKMLDAWQECEFKLATGQAKEYVVGSRRFTSIDLSDIRARVQYWEEKVDTLSGESNARRTRTVVFRDL